MLDCWAMCLEICVLRCVCLPLHAHLSSAHQVAYQTRGSPRPIMEAAAAFGFKHVCPSVVDACLAQIGRKVGRSTAQRAGALIDAYKDEWGWSKVDCARALMNVLPGKRKNKQKGPSDMAAAEGPVWEDLPSIIEALARAGQNADHEQPRPAGVDEQLDPLVEAIVAIEGAHISIQTQTLHCKPNLGLWCMCAGELILSNY